jgi:methionyl-tRNA formyltransferase
MVCRKKGITYHKVKDINSESVLQVIKQRKPDLIINLGNQIYSEKLLSIPKYGCINKHCSLLPSYKGVYPVWWAILNNEKECGVTIHYMSKEIDKGDIIIQKKVNKLAEDSFFSIYEKCYKISCQALMEAIENIKLGFNKPVKTDYTPSYFGFPGKKESKIFFQSGKKIK